MENKLASNYENNNSENLKLIPRYKLRPLPRYQVTDDIVISGIAGRFPESDNMDEFANNLFNNIDMVTSDDRRWPTDLHNGLISRGGKLKEIDKFDGSFFSTLPYFADAMDPQSRMMLETTYEAICDAGVNPQTLRGTKTGVYVGINIYACSDGIPQDDSSDIHKKELFYYMYGCLKTLYANRISYLFDFHGPSYVMDTACSASLVALVNALNDMRNGICDQAVVATANLTPAPYTNILFTKAGLLSPDGMCKAWDKSANGFVRSETVGSIFLQKSREAKRIYATVLNAKTNTDGFKPKGIYAPFWLTQRNLLIETLEEASVDPNEVKYVECHGTGTPVGDPQEAKAVADAYCSEQREEPLLIGSVKSNMGHSEGSAGLTSVAKAIITFENQCIPANLHFNDANPDIEAIVNNILKPVVTNTPYNHNIIGVNSFGIGGVNANALLKANKKIVTQEMNKIVDTIPRLVNVCGRTEEAVNYIFDFIENNPNKANKEFFGLLTNVMKTSAIKGSSNFPYRGYMIIKEKLNEDNAVQYDYTRTITIADNKQSVWLAFTGMGSQWTAMAKTLMPIKTFSDSIKRSSYALKPYNIDLMHILLSDDQNALNMQITNPFVALTSMQIALYDVILLLNLKIDGIIGHSFGEIACAYVDGCLTQEQAVLTAYWRGKVVENAKQNGKLPLGMLAAVGLSWDEIKKRCPDGIVPACHNGSDSVTISGLHDNVVAFLKQLNSENIFTQPIQNGGFPYHSSVMNIVAPQLLDALNSFIRKPKQRSNKWISTSVPPDQWDHEKARYASGEYFTNNLLSPVYFNEAMANIASDSIVIEVAPQSMFESIFKRCYSRLIYSSLMKRRESDNLHYILSSIGTLYTYGLNPDIENLYPRIEWPVSRGTQSISSLIKWDHERSNEVKKYPEYHNFSTASNFKINVSLMDSEWSFLKDHAINGKVIFPATGYLTMVWRRMAVLSGKPWNKTPIVFENIRFFRSTYLSEKYEIMFIIRVLEGTGDFTITEGSTVVCTGKVYIPDEPILEMQNTISINDKELLSSQDIYKELKIRGYDFGKKFQGLFEASDDGLRGKAKWTGNMISFLDSIFHLAVIAQQIRAMFVPIGLKSIRIEPNILFQAIEAINNEEKDATVDNIPNKYYFLTESVTKTQTIENEEIDLKQSLSAIDENLIGSHENEMPLIPVSYNKNMGSLTTTGVEINGLLPSYTPRRSAQKGLVLEKYVFISNSEELAIDWEYKEQIIEYIEVCCSLVERLSKIENNINKPVLNGYKCADELTVRCYTDSIKDNQKILTVLWNLTTIVNNCNKKSNDVNIVINNELNRIANTFDYDLLKIVFTNERLIRPLLDIVIENSVDRKNLKMLELNPTNTILAANIVNTIRKSCVGYINIDYCVVTPSPNDVPEDIKFIAQKIIEWNISEQRMLKDFSTLDLLIYRANTQISNYLSIEEQIKSLKDAVKNNGFIIIMTRNMLTRPEVAINELLNIDSNKEVLINEELDKFIKIGEKYKLKLVAKKSDSLGSTMVLLRKVNTDTTQSEIINITKGKYEQWVNVMKDKLEENRSANIARNLWFVANDTTINGLIGLVNCLRLETGGEFIRCIFDYDNKLPLPVDFTKSPYNEVIQMDLMINIYKDSEWGTYRHISISDERQTVMTEHAYLDIVTPGDMSSLKWFDSPQRFSSSLSLCSKNKNQVLCNVYYSAINFRDVLLASNRIQVSPESSSIQSIIGLEFAGRRSDNGKRVMAMLPNNGFATTVLTSNDFLWDIPDEWTLEEAATVPLVYATVYYSLIMRGNILEGESVLIHSGAGGVGQAAINICQSLNCEIFVTVGNQHKREFIRNTFNIDDTHIGNSRDTSFEEQVMTVTKGKGVDIVLNSLTDDKLQASIRCLAKNGRFLEIGKYDMQVNNNLSLLAFLKNISFHGVSIDFIFSLEPQSIKFKNFMTQLTKLLSDGIANNVVKPMVRTVFDMNECEHAFRYMTTGKHIGKVLIKIRDEERDEKIVVNPKQLIVNATVQTWFDPTKVYVLIGGLGGFGLQLAYWMTMRGANKLVLTSRTGIKNAYQKFLLNKIKEIENLFNYKIEIKVSSINANTIEGANQLIDESNRMGIIGGIFNLALVLNNAFYENQTVEAFKEVCEPKLDLLYNLDVITQAKCPQLDYFVCFSSAVAGRGNAGQTNYGYAYSAIERICEVRRNKGLHGLAVQFGLIGDVSYIAEKVEENFKLLDGYVFQRYFSCTEVLDRFLQSPFAVLSSIVKEDDIDSSGETKTEQNMFEDFCVQLNLDKRTDNEALGDIGLESMMAVEIQQRLERDFRISLTIAQIRKLSVKEFKQFSDNKAHIKYA